MKEISIYSLDWYITTERFFRIMNYNWYYIERYNCCKKKCYNMHHFCSHSTKVFYHKNSFYLFLFLNQIKGAFCFFTGCVWFCYISFSFTANVFAIPRWVFRCYTRLDQAVSRGDRRGVREQVVWVWLLKSYK